MGISVVTSYINPRTNVNDRRAQETVDPIQRYIDEVIIYGSVERVIDELKRLEEEVPLNYLLASPLSHDSFMRLSHKPK